MNKDKSALITNGLRNSFRDGTSKLANRVCYGYPQDESGSLDIFGPETETVRWTF